MAKKKYMSASLLKLGDRVYKPGDIVKDIPDEEERRLLAIGKLYPLPAKKNSKAKSRVSAKEESDECI